MQMNQGGQPLANPYMRPMGRNSLSQAPVSAAPAAHTTPAAPAQHQQYTSNEPEDESRPVLLSSETPSEEELNEKPSEMPRESSQVEAPMVILPREEPAEEEPAIQEEEPAEELLPVPQEEEETEEKLEEIEDTAFRLPFEAVPAAVLSPEEPQEPAQTEEPIDYAAAYMASLTVQQEEEPEAGEESVEPEAEEETEEPEEGEDLRDSAEDAPAGEVWEEEPAYAFDPAYYAAYWQQWQNAMEAHQAETCAACPLVNNQRGKVYFVPVIVPDGTEEVPEAVLSLRSARPQPETAQEESIPAAPAERREETDDEDEDFTGEDAMPSEDMPTPQTVPVGVEIGQTKETHRKWPWILLAVAALLAGGVFAAGRTGVLQDVLNWLGLPESVAQWFRNIGVM